MQTNTYTNIYTVEKKKKKTHTHSYETLMKFKMQLIEIIH